MSSFPWEKFKAVTLRSACKDIGAPTGTNRNRDEMVAFLKDVETRGLEAVLLKMVPAAMEMTIVASSESTSSDVLIASGDDEWQDSDDEQTCGCQNGWLSPRTKFALKVTAGLAEDLVPDTGELAGVYGHVGATFLSNYIDPEYLPGGKKSGSGMGRRVRYVVWGHL